MGTKDQIVWHRLKITKQLCLRGEERCIILISSYHPHCDLRRLTEMHHNGHIMTEMVEVGFSEAT